VKNQDFMNEQNETTLKDYINLIRQNLLPISIITLAAVGIAVFYALTSTNIIRSFDLTITFNPTDIIDVDGRINLTLRKNEENKWQITNWLDESNF